MQILLGGGKQTSQSSPMLQNLHNSTSVSQEPLLQMRVFTTTGNIVSASCSRLAPENLDRLIFLHEDLTIMEYIFPVTKLILHCYFTANVVCLNDYHVYVTLHSYFSEITSS